MILFTSNYTHRYAKTDSYPCASDSVVLFRHCALYKFTQLLTYFPDIC